MACNKMVATNHEYLIFFFYYFIMNLIGVYGKLKIEDNLSCL